MQNTLIEFTNEANQAIHAELINGEPYFLAKDVCDILGHTNPTKAIQLLDDDEHLTSPVVRAGQTRDMNFVSESGLYNLIFKSTKPAAKAFRKWVTGTVLPQIRKTGSFSTTERSQKLIEDYIEHRDKPHQYWEFNGVWVKKVVHEDQNWYATFDISEAIGVSTKSNTTYKQLNQVRILCKRFWLVGMTHPGWFVVEEGVPLLIMNSRKLRMQKKTFNLAFGNSPQQVKQEASQPSLFAAN